VHGVRNRGCGSPEQAPQRSGGALGRVAGDPAQAGKALWIGVCAAVTTRLIAAGYRNLHLYTEPWRLAASKAYLKLGYLSLLYAAEMPER
jgi:mycothiol synthase